MGSKATRKRAFACALAAGALALAGCGGDDEASTSGGGDSGGSAPTETKEIKVGLGTIGPRNDKSFSQSHVEGVQQAEKDTPGVKLTSIVDNLEDPTRRIDAFKNLAPTNDLIIGGSATFNQTAEAVAPQFPDKHFIVSTGGTEKKLDNVTSLVPEEGQSAVVAGAVMASLTKTKKVGAIGGAEIPPTMISIAGVKAGIADTDPSIAFSDTIVGNFNDAAKAKQAAQAMIDEGVDQIFAFLDAGVQGVYQAAEESGKDVNVYSIITLNCEDSKTLVGSAMQENKVMISQAIADFAAGALEPGTVFYTLKSPEIVRFQLCPQWEEKPEVAKIVEETTKRIVDGDLEVPADALNPRPSFDFIEK
jgi:basic membrane protein A